MWDKMGGEGKDANTKFRGEIEVRYREAPRIERGGGRKEGNKKTWDLLVFRPFFFFGAFILYKTRSHYIREKNENHSYAKWSFWPGQQKKKQKFFFLGNHASEFWGFCFHLRSNLFNLYLPSFYSFFSFIYLYLTFVLFMFSLICLFLCPSNFFLSLVFIYLSSLCIVFSSHFPRDFFLKISYYCFLSLS